MMNEQKIAIQNFQTNSHPVGTSCPILKCNQDNISAILWILLLLIYYCCIIKILCYYLLKVEEMIEDAKSSLTKHRYQPKEPLIRLKVNDWGKQHCICCFWGRICGGYLPMIWYTYMTCACLLGYFFMNFGIAMGGFLSQTKCPIYINWVYFKQIIIKSTQLKWDWVFSVQIYKICILMGGKQEQK